VTYQYGLWCARGEVLNVSRKKQSDSTAPPSPLAASLSVFEAKEGFEQILVGELTKLVRKSRQEAGCLLFDLYRVSGKYSAFALYEVWELREALEAHLGNFHTTSFKVASEQYLAQPIQVFELEEMM
jgi:quinol monooxygenase YgiN